MGVYNELHILSATITANGTDLATPNAFDRIRSGLLIDCYIKDGGVDAGPITGFKIRDSGGKDVLNGQGGAFTIDAATDKLIAFNDHGGIGVAGALDVEGACTNPGGQITIILTVRS